MRRYILFVVVLLSLAGCGRHSKQRPPFVAKDLVVWEEASHYVVYREGDVCVFCDEDSVEQAFDVTDVRIETDACGDCTYTTFMRGDSSMIVLTINGSYEGIPDTCMNFWMELKVRSINGNATKDWTGVVSRNRESLSQWIMIGNWNTALLGRDYGIVWYKDAYDVKWTMKSVMRKKDAGEGLSRMPIISCFDLLQSE